MLDLDYFKIISVERSYQDTVKVRVRVDAKVWHAMKKRGDLGHMYGVDISNRVHRDFGVKAWCPTVSDRDRARGGLKFIDLYYADALWVPAPDNVIKVDFQAKRRFKSNFRNDFETLKNENETA